jgi:hypothetical protein
MRNLQGSKWIGVLSATALLGLAACSSGFSAGTGFSVGGGDGGGTSGGAGSGGGAAGGAGGGTGGAGGTAAGGGSASASGALERTTGAVGGLTGGVLAVAGNAPLLNQAGLGRTLAGTGAAVQKDGLAALPLAGSPVAGVVKTADNAINPLGKVVVLDQTVLGSSASASNQLVGVSALSPGQAQGQLATVGVLSSGGGAAGPLAPLAQAGDLLKVSVDGATLVGGQGQALIGASVLSPTQAQGTAVTAGVLSGGGGTAANPLAPATGLVGGLVGGGGTSPGAALLAPVAGVVGGVTGVVGGLLGN